MINSPLGFYHRRAFLIQLQAFTVKVFSLKAHVLFFPGCAPCTEYPPWSCCPGTGRAVPQPVLFLFRVLMTELERFSELPVALPLPTEPAPWGTLALQGLGERGSEELELGQFFCFPSRHLGNRSSATTEHVVP